MADYIYLLENRLSPAQRTALRNVREVARFKGLTVFLVGGAVRDLTSGSPIRDLDVVVQGNALKLRKDIEKIGGVITGENEAGQALYVRFPGSVRMEIGSTLSVTFPKPGKAVGKPATILDDLRRRDFTANAMALSLNEGSYGLLMDPLNGVADIENRQLRLVSNYGFIEDPVRMVRAARLMARLGWSLDEKTQTRYDTGREEGYISAMSEFHRGYETEEIAHEEDPLRVLRRLETEGWMKQLAPYWTVAKVNVAELERLQEARSQLQMQGIHPDMAAASFPLLTAKLSAKEAESLKASFPRQGFVAEIEALEEEARVFAAQLTGKGAALPSQAWKSLTSAKPESVLWVAFSGKGTALQAKFKSFYTEWPQARQKMPYTMMQEMRIVPDLPGYDDLLEKLFFELMDGKLSTPEEMKAFLEPYSPPAPPPPMSMRRLRTAKKEAKPAKSRAKKAVKDETEGEDAPGLTQASEPVAAAPVPTQPELAKGVPKTVAGASVAQRAAVKEVPAKTNSAKPSAIAKSSAIAKPLASRSTATKRAVPLPSIAAKAAKKAAPAKAPTAAKTAKKAGKAKKVAVAPAKKAAPAGKTVQAKKPGKPSVNAVSKAVPAKKTKLQVAGAAKKSFVKVAQKPAAKPKVKAAAKKVAGKSQTKVVPSKAAKRR